MCQTMETQHGNLGVELILDTQFKVDPGVKMAISSAFPLLPFPFLLSSSPFLLLSNFLSEHPLLLLLFVTFPSYWQLSIYVDKREKQKTLQNIQTYILPAWQWQKKEALSSSVHIWNVEWSWLTLSDHDLCGQAKKVTDTNHEDVFWT